MTSVYSTQPTAPQYINSGISYNTSYAPSSSVLPSEMSATSTTYLPNSTHDQTAAVQAGDFSLTTQEKATVATMCQRVVNEGFGDRVSEDMVVQFLMARKFDIERAMPLLYAHLQWKAANQILGDKVPLTPNILRELESGRVVVPPASRDVSGAQVIYFKPALLNSAITTNPQELCISVYFLLQRCIQDIRTQRLGFLLVCDLRGTKMTQVDHKLVRAALDMLSNKFPGRLRKVLLLEPPKFFRFVFRMIRPLMAQKYLDKIQVINLPDISQHIHPSALLPEFGGTLGFDQRAFIGQLQIENNKISATAAVPPSVFGVAAR